MGFDLIKIFNGYKTYIVGIATILYGIVGLVIGQNDANVSLQFVLTGLTALTLRHGIGSKVF